MHDDDIERVGQGWGILCLFEDRLYNLENTVADDC